MNNELKIGIAVLAAGSSSRLGRPKQLLLLPNGQSLLMHTLKVVDAFSFPDHIWLITGAYREQIMPAISEIAVDEIFNPNWSEGMSTSLILGVKEAMYCNLDGLIICVGDQPGLNENVFSRMYSEIKQSADKIIISKYLKGAGPPSYFPSKYFKDLLAISGDQGAQEVVRKYGSEILFINFPGGEEDIDTEESYQRLFQK